MNEMGSTYSQLLIEDLLKVHALTNMHRASGNDKHRIMAAGWLPSLEDLMASLKRELLKKADTK